MYYIYILLSEKANLYYVGYSNDPHRRLFEHNNRSILSFTAKHRPWILKAVFSCGEQEKDAVKLERFIKKQKSRVFIEKLIDPKLIPAGVLAQLVRVPYVRD